jgi:hypothetical protein
MREKLYDQNIDLIAWFGDLEGAMWVDKCVELYNDSGPDCVRMRIMLLLLFYATPTYIRTCSMRFARALSDTLKHMFRCTIFIHRAVHHVSHACCGIACHAHVPRVPCLF